MKKLLYAFLLGALVIHVIPLSAGNGNDKEMIFRKKRYNTNENQNPKSIQSNSQEQNNNNIKMYLAGGILFIITGVGIVYFIPKNSLQTNPEIEAYKKWIETREPLPEGLQPNENALYELAKEETKDKDYKKRRDWINIRNDEMINKLVKIYMSNKVDISYVEDSQKPEKGIGNIVENMMEKHANSLELAYMIGQTLHLLDNIGHDKKEACIHSQNDFLLMKVALLHRSNELDNTQKPLKNAFVDTKDIDEKEQPNLIPLIQVLLDHDANPEAKQIAENGSWTIVDLAGHLKLTIEKKGGKWKISPKQE